MVVAVGGDRVQIVQGRPPAEEETSPGRFRGEPNRQ